MPRDRTYEHTYTRNIYTDDPDFAPISVWQELKIFQLECSRLRRQGPVRILVKNPGKPFSKLGTN